MKIDAWDCLMVLGGLLVIGGIGWHSVPGAMVVAGLALWRAGSRGNAGVRRG